MTPTPLPDLYARVAAKVPDIAIEFLERNGGYWLMGYPGLHIGISEAHAELLIIGACFKWLTEGGGAVDQVLEPDAAAVLVDDDLFRHPTLAGAMLLAVEAEHDFWKENDHA